MKVTSPIIITSPTSYNKFHLFTPISNPASSVISSYNSSTYTGGHNPTHRNQDVVQYVRDRKDVVINGGVYDVASYTMRAVNWSHPCKEDRAITSIRACNQTFWPGGLFCELLQESTSGNGISKVIHQHTSKHTMLHVGKVYMYIAILVGMLTY